jgi:hypothetical protein
MPCRIRGFIDDHSQAQKGRKSIYTFDSICG